MRYEIESHGNMPFTLNEVKAYLKVDTNDDDTVINDIISAVVNHAERITRRELRNNKWFGFPGSFDCLLEIRRKKVEQITKIEYLYNGVANELDPSNYYLQRGTLSSIILLAEGASWPNTDTYSDPIRISFDTSPDPKLPQIRVQMLRNIAALYENRGDDLVGPYFGLEGKEGMDFYGNYRIPNF